MKEPNINDQAFMRNTGHGFWFVRYRDGEISRLMPKDIAEDYASIFGGEVVQHTEAPAHKGRNIFLHYLLVLLLLATGGWFLL